MRKSLEMTLCVAALLCGLGCGVVSEDGTEVARGQSVAALVTCQTDSMGLCTPATAGQPCTKADGTMGTCTSSVSGCLCVGGSSDAGTLPTFDAGTPPPSDAGTLPPSDAGTVDAGPALVTCQTDSMRLCTPQTAGQPCRKANGGTGTCTSTAYLGCQCQ